MTQEITHISLHQHNIYAYTTTNFTHEHDHTFLSFSLLFLILPVTLLFWIACMPSSTVLFPSRTGVSDAPLLYILGYYHVHFFRGYKFTFLFLRKIVFLFFPHYIRISYIHQHPLIPRGPIESFSLLYLHEPFTFMSICYRHFIFSYLLVFFCKRTLLLSSFYIT